jgi:cbb3-type cytochrome oxidase subunit 3
VRLSDIMSGMDLTTFPIIGLVIFLIVFAAVSVRALSRRFTKQFSEAASMPLQSEIMSFDPDQARGARS